MTVHMDADALRDSVRESVRLFGGPHRRPLPADFREFATGRSLFAICQNYATCPKTAERWLQEAGVERKKHVQTFEVPADFAEIGPTLHIGGLGEHYGVSPSTARRWCQTSGVVPAPPPRAAAVAVPPDFTAIAPTKTRTQLTALFNTSVTTLMKWCRAVGVEPKPAPSRKRTRAASMLPATDPSLAAQAAQFLRSRIIVYRCDILEAHERAKLPNKGKGLWYVNGRGAISADQLIALAESKGFDARAWARI